MTPRDLHTLTVRIRDADPGTGIYQLDGQPIKGLVSLSIDVRGEQDTLVTLVLEAAVEGELALVEKTYGVRERLGVLPWDGAPSLHPDSENP